MVIAVVLLVLAVPAFAKGSSDTKAKGVVELEFFLFKPEAVDTYNELIKKFTAENPGITVTVNAIGDPKLRAVLYTRLASGDDVPDVFSSYPNEPQFAELVRDGYLYDLSSQAFLKNVSPSVLQGVAQNGKSFALPISLNTVGVFYNTELFGKLGIAIPQTYAEFISAAKKIKASGITPFAMSAKDTWTVGIIANLSSGAEMGKATADKFFADLNKGTTSATKNQTMKTVAERILEIASLSNDDAVAVDYSTAINMFATGKTAMYINGIWAIPSVEKANPELKFSMFPLPAINKADTKTIYGIDASVSMAAKSKHPAEALKFLEFLARQDNAQYYSDKDNSPSVVKGVQVKSEKIVSLSALMDKGASFEWLHFKWASGQEGRWNDAAAKLVFEKDVGKYLRNLDEIFLNSLK